MRYVDDKFTRSIPNLDSLTDGKAQIAEHAIFDLVENGSSKKLRVSESGSAYEIDLVRQLIYRV